MANKEDLRKKLFGLDVDPSTDLSEPLLQVMGVHEEDSCRILQCLWSNGFKTWQALMVLRSHEHAMMMCGGDEVNGAIIFTVVQRYKEKDLSTPGEWVLISTCMRNVILD